MGGFKAKGCHLFENCSVFCPRRPRRQFAGLACYRGSSAASIRSAFARTRPLVISIFNASAALGHDRSSPPCARFLRLWLFLHATVSRHCPHLRCDWRGSCSGSLSEPVGWVSVSILDESPRTRRRRLGLGWSLMSLRLAGSSSTVGSVKVRSK